MTVDVYVGALMLLFASVYLGMGFSLVVLQFPGAAATTKAANFPERFGDPVRRAVATFTVVSVLMLIGGAWLTVRDWDNGDRRLLSLLFTVMVVAATAFTVVFILPVNRVLYGEIADESYFTTTLRRWIRLNVVRYLFWIVEWFAITGWFIMVALQ
jgi:anthrone oxygenase-like protein